MKFYEPKGEHKIQNNNIPEVPGVYFLWSKKELIYIGYSHNLRKRIAQHSSESIMNTQMVDLKLIFKVSIMLTKNEEDAKRIEQELINLIPTMFNKNPFYKSNQPKDDVKGALKSYEELF